MTVVIRPTVSLAEANLYFASRLRSTAWTAADETSKLQALAQASNLVSGAFIFSEDSYRVEDDVVTWDERISFAICEEALWLLGHDPSELPESLTKGIQSASAGSVSATFDKSFVIPWICDAVKTLIGDLGTFIGDSSESSVRSTLLAL